MKKYLDQIAKTRKETIYNYKYTYFDPIEKDERYSKIYGESRKGYEDYCRDNNVQVSYSGIVSYREVIDRRTKDVIKVILEEKLSTTPQTDAAEEIYNEALQEAKKILKVEDEESFMYYVESNVYFFDYRREVDGYINAINKLENIIEEYNEDEDFKKFFDKIIKA